MAFGERVKRARIAKGLKQTELADIVGVTSQSLYKYECGIVENLPLNVLINICKALGTDPNTLLGWNDEKKVFKVKVRRIKTHERSNSI